METKNALDSVGEIREYLTDLININTTRDNGDNKAIVDYLKKVFADMGIDATVYENGTEVCGISAVVKGASSEKVVLYSHLDTAPFGNVSKWHFPADKATYKNHCMCGRGSLDGKSLTAIWIKLLSEIKKTSASGKTVVFVADVEVSDENGNAKRGLEYILSDTELFKDSVLAIGEGGGIPFPFKGKMYFTFQTAEREAFNYSLGIHDPGDDAVNILKMGLEKGYYDNETIEYCMENQGMLVRRLETEPLFFGMKEFFESAGDNDSYSKFGQIFREAIRNEVPDGEVMPIIKDGITGNTLLREKGIRTVGFFPLDIQNSLSGLNGENEYITDKSIELSYRVLKNVMSSIIY